MKRLLLVSFLSILLVGCGIIDSKEKQPDNTPLPSNAPVEQVKQQNPDPLQEPKVQQEVTPVVQPERPKDIVEEANDQFMKQRMLDQQAKNEWWESQRKHQKELLQMQQDYQKEILELNGE